MSHHFLWIKWKMYKKKWTWFATEFSTNRIIHKWQPFFFNYETYFPALNYKYLHGFNLISCKQYGVWWALPYSGILCTILILTLLCALIVSFKKKKKCSCQCSAINSSHYQWNWDSILWFLVSGPTFWFHHFSVMSSDYKSFSRLVCWWSQSNCDAITSQMCHQLMMKPLSQAFGGCFQLKEQHLLWNSAILGHLNMTTSYVALCYCSSCLLSISRWCSSGCSWLSRKSSLTSSWGEYSSGLTTHLLCACLCLSAVILSYMFFSLTRFLRTSLHRPISDIFLIHIPHIKR